MSHLSEVQITLIHSSNSPVQHFSTKIVLLERNAIFHFSDKKQWWNSCRKSFRLVYNYHTSLREDTLTYREVLRGKSHNLALSVSIFGLTSYVTKTLMLYKSFWFLVHRWACKALLCPCRSCISVLHPSISSSLIIYFGWSIFCLTCRFSNNCFCFKFSVFLQTMEATPSPDVILQDSNMCVCRTILVSKSFPHHCR